MSFLEVHDLALAAALADFCLLLKGFEAGIAGLLVGVLALLRGAA